MSSLKVYDKSGGEVGNIDLPEGLLELEKGTQAVRDAVVAHMAAKRAGTASTKSKGEVAGSNKKPWRQKGTGRARAGYRQSPVWRGGGVAFGPKPRDYSKKINSKVSRLAFRRALSEKLTAGQVRVVDILTVEEAKTKSFVALMKALGIERKLLVLVDAVDDKLLLAARNIQGVEVMKAAEASVYQLLRYPEIIVNRAGMDILLARLEGKA
jgi:large subunit ribosomal protein L4